MEDPILDTNGNEEQEFQVKIDIGSKSKMYSTATNFGKSLATNDLATQVDYKSNTGEESPVQKSGSPWRNKSNKMKRLSLDLPEAFGQVNEEIKEVGDDIESLIDSIKSYRNSLHMDSKLKSPSRNSP